MVSTSRSEATSTTCNMGQILAQDALDFEYPCTTVYIEEQEVRHTVEEGV